MEMLVTIVLITLAISLLIYWISYKSQWDLMQLISAFVVIISGLTATVIGWIVIIKGIILLWH